VNEMLAGFWFVGSHSDCDRLIAAVAPDLGAPPTARARNTAQQWRKQVYWPPLTAEDLSPAQRQAVLSRNPLDTAIWQSWRSAGLDTASIRPLPLESGAGDGFVAQEMARPAFLTARWLQRSGLWRSGGRSKTGLRSGFAKADQARYAGQWRLAAERYRRALDEEPRAPAIWVQYGHVLKLCGELAAAEQAYRESLRFDPDNADTHLQLGHVLALQHRPGEAAEAYRHALALDPALDAAAAGLSAAGGAEPQVSQRVGDAA
jgi:tetratricopeptide (TPR) repeat protein